MEVVPLAAEAEVARVAADAVEDLVRRRTAAGRPTVLGLATGSTPLATYAELIARCRAGRAPDYGSVETFNLDEYVGLPPGHEQSYLATIRRELTDALAIPADRVHGPDPTPAGLPEAGERYEAAIREAGGIDLQILGIGGDGHIGFNEPGSSLASLTRIKTLTERTRRDNARFFGSADSPEDVPRHVLTQGIATILRAGHLLLLATGEGKAAAVAAAVEGPVTASCPASALQLHPHVSVILDEGAASGLARLDYYREVWAAKPTWQRL